MERVNYIKGMFVALSAAIGAKLGLLWMIVPFVLMCMIIDYATGCLAARKEKVISSKTGMWGIVKKLGYGIEIVIGLIIDYLIINISSYIGIKVPRCSFFALVIAVWIIANEIRSILENLVRLEVSLPPFLEPVVSAFKVAVEKKGQAVVDSIKNNEEIEQ